MTDTQKEQILQLRAEGLGYVRIAREIGVSENTVKSFCRRYAKLGAGSPMVVMQEQTQSFFCCQCGVEVPQNPGRKLKRFCSDACRTKWWNAHAGQLNRKTMHRYKCPSCGREFEVYGTAKRKYCSHDCYINARFYSGGGSHD